MLLKELIDNNDAKGVNDVSHKMLGMFRQLKATRLITFLEEFEVSKEINKTSWKDFEKELEIFLVEIKKYLN
nr:hypothetical protein BACY1_16270 [Tenacibaculum mesophilum]